MPKNTRCKSYPPASIKMLSWHLKRRPFTSKLSECFQKVYHLYVTPCGHVAVCENHKMSIIKLDGIDGAVLMVERTAGGRRKEIPMTHYRTIGVPPFKKPKMNARRESFLAQKQRRR